MLGPEQTTFPSPGMEGILVILVNNLIRESSVIKSIFVIMIAK